MKPFVAAIALVLAVALAGGPAAAQSPIAMGPDDQAAIRAVIESQIEAFRADDGERAFSFASPGIRSMFRTPENFMRMVKTGYQPVYRPLEVDFHDIVDYRGKPTQRVLLVGPDSVPVVAWYTMERQPDGTWRIAGCELKGSDQAVI